MKKLLVIALLVFTARLQAQVRIGENEAYSTAEQFLQQNTKYQNVVLSLNEVVHSKRSGEPNLFVFAMEPHGFVIVSATGEVLAYSLNSGFPSTNELPAHIAYWIDLYNTTTDYIIEHHLPNLQRKASQQEVMPLVTSAWGQGCFHNELCPAAESGPCHHVSAGCTAIAMAQIMYYHKQPLTGNGEVSYKSPPYGTLSANFGQTTYPWGEMADTLHESNLATALLVSHCGISARMNYGPQLSLSSTQNALKAFQNHFFYPSSTLLLRSDSNDEEWTNLIKDNLDRHLPVYYSGISTLGGHAFVCDGYDSNGMFHFNFGWDGVADGYYTLESPSGFTDDQKIIHNILPASQIAISGDSHGIIYVSPDGTGDGSSWAQATSELQSAIYKAPTEHLTIWAKEGTYLGTGHEGYCFNVFGNCQIFGGFQGNEPYDYDLSLRDFEAHPSILDGNLTQGLFNVSYCDSILIDGFTLQNGFASSGGGILTSCSTRIRNCKICHNQAQSSGGGIAMSPTDETVKMVIEDCEFFGNEAKYGGAIYDGGNATYQHCKIHDNTVAENGGGIHRTPNYLPSLFMYCQISNNTARAGGGVYSGSRALFWSCLVNNNTAETGGGCYIGGETKLYNCTVVKNEGLVEYGGVYSSKLNNQCEIKNCILWGNLSPEGNQQIGPAEKHTCCAIEGYPMSSSLNFRADSENDGESPNFYVRFVDADVAAGSAGHGGDWHLQSNSLCIDRVDSIATQPATDLDGHPRHRHNKVDLGAYESDVVAFVIKRFFCDGDYYHNDTLLPAPGTYSFLYPDATYDSLVIVQLEREVVIMQRTICEGETFDFLSQTLHEAGHYTFMSNCKIYELDLFVTPMPTVTMEAEICEGETYNFYGETLNEEGHYSTTHDCKKYELDLTVNPLPIITLEKEICANESYNFFGQMLNKAGHYSTVKDCQAFELDLSVKPSPALRCSNDTLIEYGNSVQLSAAGADSYLWSTGETTESITVAPTANKTYSVTGFYENGCETMTTVNVTVKDQRNDDIILFPNPACDKVKIYLPFIDEVDIFDLFGEHICHIEANREAVELDVSQFTDGVYVIQVKQLKNLYHKKLIIRH